MRTGQRLNPLSSIINPRLGSALYYLRRYDEAAAALRQAITLDSTSMGTRAELGRVLIKQRHLPGAFATFPHHVDRPAGQPGGGLPRAAAGRAGLPAPPL